MKTGRSKSTKRFWLKIPANFFEHSDMLMLERYPNYERLQNIWLRLLTFCLKPSPEEPEAGILRLSDTIPYDERILSSVLRVDLDYFRVAFKIFTDLGMVVVMDDETIYVEAIQRLIGSETDAAARMRALRARQKKPKKPGVTLLPKSSEQLRHVEERSDSRPTPVGGVAGLESEQEEVETLIRSLEDQTQKYKTRRA